MNNNSFNAIELGGEEMSLLVEKKATCPFIGSALAEGALSVINDTKNPLASIDETKRLGNTGGGDLGGLLAFFASGNHASMRGDSGSLDKPVPNGLFSLEFPGSQGSHPGHSGILQGDPETLDSGRFSETDFSRLTSRAKDGWIKRSDVGAFIAENLLRDPNSKVFSKNTIDLLAGDLKNIVKAIGPALFKKVLGSDEDSSNAHRDLEEKLTRLMGEDNMAGSSGEFGLLFAFLANKPDAPKIDGEPALAVQDLRAMFVDKRLPDGWETWKKTKFDWVKNTTALLIDAAKAYREFK